MDRRSLFIDKYGSVFAATFVFAVLLFMVVWQSGAGFGYFDITLLAQGGAALALAAIGATLVILSGGFDLSVGAVISLVNVVVASGVVKGDGPLAFLLVMLLSVAVGALCGLINGACIAYGRLQPIVVTLSTMFILQGVTLLVMDSPGGSVPPVVSTVFMGDLLTDLVPMPIFLVGMALLFWAWAKRTGFGLHLYAVGGSMSSAKAVGVNVQRTLLLTYTAAGAMYGLAGLFISAQTGSGDPLVGNSLLLSVFAAVVIGGTRLGGGRGGPMGSVIGAFVLMIIVNILLIFNISAYYSTIAQGLVLIIAVMLSSLGPESSLRVFVRRFAKRIVAFRNGTLASQRGRSSQSVDVCQNSSVDRIQVSLWMRHRKDIKTSLPALVAFVIVALATAAIMGRDISQWSYWNSLIVLSTFLIILAMGQGAVIFTGGLDLSLPWTISLCAFLFTGLTQGSNEGLLYALIVVLLAGAIIGAANGIMVAVLGISPIVATLATNGILQGIALLYSQGTPSGFPPPVITWVMTGRAFGITPIVYGLVLFVCFAVFLFTRTAFGRHVYATGSNSKAAMLSGVPTNRILVLVYMVSGVCAAAVGVLLTGFSGQASLGMGDDYLLPSIAVIVVGGGLITGGRGHYLGILAGVLLLTALQMLLAGSGLPYAARPIIFGAVLLAAVATLRERHS